MANVVPKVYARLERTQNEGIHKHLCQMPCAGRTQRSTMDHMTIISAIIEK